MGVPNGGGSTHTYNRGDIVELPDDEYALLEGRRQRDGTRWIELTDKELRTIGPVRWRKGEPHKNSFRKRGTGRVCNECGAEFKYPSELAKHRRTHEPYICKLCGEAFDTSQALGGHTKREHQNKNRKRTDPVTGAPIPRRVRLDRTPPGSNACDYCGRSFTTTGGLKVHIGRNHKGEKDEFNL